jgi:hypothetical protein
MHISIKDAYFASELLIGNLNLRLSISPLNLSYDQYTYLQLCMYNYTKRFCTLAYNCTANNRDKDGPLYACTLLPCFLYFSRQNMMVIFNASCQSAYNANMVASKLIGMRLAKLDL